MKKLNKKELKEIRESKKMFQISSNFERELWGEDYKKWVTETAITARKSHYNPYFGSSCGKYYMLENNIIKCVRDIENKRITSFWKIA